MLLSQIPQGVNPLTPQQSQQIELLLGSLTPVQQAWISGYLAASANAAGNTPGAMPTLAAPGVEASPLTILYGSQTGNAKSVASDLAAKAKARGMEVKLVAMSDYKPNQLKNEKYLAIVVSTYGEGEPPEGAEKLHAFLSSKKAPKLNDAKITVIGLGDSSYEFFCQTAKDFEERLSALGASVAFERALLDVDYDDEAAGWIDGAVEVFEPILKAANETAGPAAGIAPSLSLVPALEESPYNKKNPFDAEISVVQKITGRDSDKDVRHVEISLEGSGLHYSAGDSLGVYFLNDAEEIKRLLALLKLNAESKVKVGNESKALDAALIEDYELTQSYPAFVEKYGAATNNETLIGLSEDKAVLRAYIEDRQIIDIIHEHPAKIDAQTLIDCLRKVQPRLYSIASSQEEVEDEVHLTVAVVDYEAHERSHLGGCSGHLGRRATEGDHIRVYVEHNDNFRLPPSPETPVIMIGPGTGIAPFRAFLQDRDNTGATGDNWLFFGNPHFTQDFLYQVELQSYLKTGLLQKLSVAFSRDQAEKIYVQERIVENGAEVYEWLERGAHLYICGDGSRMAKDVHEALKFVLIEHGKLSDDEADSYLERLRDDKRYQKDVY